MERLISAGNRNLIIPRLMQMGKMLPCADSCSQTVQARASVAVGSIQGRQADPLSKLRKGLTSCQFGLASLFFSVRVTKRVKDRVATCMCSLSIFMNDHASGIGLSCVFLPTTLLLSSVVGYPAYYAGWIVGPPVNRAASNDSISLVTRRLGRILRCSSWKLFKL